MVAEVYGDYKGTSLLLLLSLLLLVLLLKTSAANPKVVVVVLLQLCVSFVFGGVLALLEAQEPTGADTGFSIEA